MMKPRLAVLLTMIATAAAMRLLPHLPNFTPVAALALFGGANFADKRLAFLVPLAALFLSDLVLGLHDTMGWVYLSFALTVGLGIWLHSHRSVLTVAGAAIASSIIFFIVVDLGIWAAGTMYPRTLAGLEACYIAAIPFLRTMVMGDLFYAALLFGGFALLERAFPVLREQAAPQTAAA
jgi:hypothetical protein